MAEKAMVMPRGGEAVAESPLLGARVCLVFEHSLSHYTRILQEIDALKAAGAEVQLLTQHSATEPPPQGLTVTYAPLLRFAMLPDTSVTPRLPGRVLSSLEVRIRSAWRRGLRRQRVAEIARARAAAIDRIAAAVDIFWVVDYPSLPAVMDGAAVHGTKVVYETVDLVPEYEYDGPEAREANLADEKRRLALVDGFVTACDSYADYYLDRCGDVLDRAPVVRDNTPAQVVCSAKDVVRPLRALFLGSLMFDRPVVELIEAMGLASADMTLTFQGKNYLGDAPSRRIVDLGLEDHVLLVDPCPPEDIVMIAREYDIGIVALRGDNINERYASTSKLFTYMSAGLAILGSDLPGIARIVGHYKNGLLVEGIEPHGWAQGLNQIAGLPDTTIQAMKQSSLDAAREHAWDVQEKLFVGEFSRALGRPVAPR